MSLVQINRKADPPRHFALFTAGFRPFFLAAPFFAALSMFAWMCIYFSLLHIGTGDIVPAYWHAHEMIYGYCMAVIAGFLLTAVQNWTGIETITSRPLIGLVAAWLVARISFLFSQSAVAFGLAAAADLLFTAFLLFAVVSPIVQARQWRQMGIVAKLVLLFVGNAAFYCGVWSFKPALIVPALYGGLYLIIGLILTIAGRVFPAFITNVVETNVAIKNPRSLSAISMIVFLIFFINQLFFLNPSVLFWSSLLLAVVTTSRLFLWHHVGIWKRPLLWSMYLSLVAIDFGFILFALSAGYGINPLLAVHSLAAGGIGLVTVAMMARVILGHSGRDVRQPVRGVSICFLLLAIGALFRVIMPLVSMAHYPTWIFVSQTCWIVGFSLFGVIHFKILVEPSRLLK